MSLGLNLHGGHDFVTLLAHQHTISLSLHSKRKGMTGQSADFSSLLWHSGFNKFYFSDTTCTAQAEVRFSLTLFTELPYLISNPTVYIVKSHWCYAKSKSSSLIIENGPK